MSECPRFPDCSDQYLCYADAKELLGTYLRHAAPSSPDEIDDSQAANRARYAGFAQDQYGVIERLAHQAIEDSVNSCGICPLSIILPDTTL